MTAPLRGQLGSPVNREKVYGCHVLFIPSPLPRSKHLKGQLDPPVNHEKVYACHVFAYSHPAPLPQVSWDHPRVTKSENFLDSKIFVAKIFWIKHVNCIIFSNVRQIRVKSVFAFEA